MLRKMSGKILTGIEQWCGSEIQHNRPDSPLAANTRNITYVSDIAVLSADNIEMGYDNSKQKDMKLAN